jgi:hypothetical protein
MGGLGAAACAAGTQAVGQLTALTEAAAQADKFAAALAAVVLAKALELQSQLYPMRQYVWEIIKAEKAAETALREASLSSIAICVLELAARPSLDNRSDYILLAGVS